MRNCGHKPTGGGTRSYLVPNSAGAECSVVVSVLLLTIRTRAIAQTEQRMSREDICHSERYEGTTSGMLSICN